MEVIVLEMIVKEKRWNKNSRILSGFTRVNPTVYSKLQYNTTKNLLIKHKIWFNFLTKAIATFGVPTELIFVSKSAICWIKSK